MRKIKSLFLFFLVVYTGGQLSATGLFPRSDPVTFLYTADLRGRSLATRLMATTLQGLVSRKAPAIYLMTRENDRLWLQHLETRFEIPSEPVADPWQLLETFREHVSGAIVYDPLLLDSVNVATTMAGIEGAIVIGLEDIARVMSLDIPLLADLRGRWQDKYAAYRWAWKNLWPRCTHSLLADLLPDQVGLRDYIVQHRVFTFNLRPLSGDWLQEASLFNQVLEGSPPNIPLIGYIAHTVLEEGVALTLISAQGKVLVPTDVATNLSVHSGIEPVAVEPDEPELPPLENKVYVTFVMSDGDNLGYDMNTMREYWDAPERGQIPLGWTVSPYLMELAPAVMDYFYSTRTAMDGFVAGPSGAGYIFPPLYRDISWYLETSRRYLEAMDLRTVWLLNGLPFYSDELLEEYRSHLDIYGLLTDYFPVPVGLPFYYTTGGLPVLRAIFTLDRVFPRDVLQFFINLHRLFPQEPVFLLVGVNVWVMNVQDVYAWASSLGQDVVLVRPDVILQLMQQHSRAIADFRFQISDLN
jgi:hypothetical protein